MHRDDKPVQAQGVVHHLVAATAKEIAGHVYEECARADPAFYRLWPNQAGFIRRRWSSFIQAARDSLADALRQENHFMSTEAMRQTIHEALLLNAAAAPAQNMLEKKEEPPHDPRH